MLKLSVVAALALLAAAPAFADDWDFVLINNTGKGIKAIELAPAGTANWQANQPDPDMERKAAIGSGARMTVRFDKGPGCRYDVKATFVDDTGATWANINVCDNSYVTLSVNASGAATFKQN